MLAGYKFKILNEKQVWEDYFLVLGHDSCHSMKSNSCEGNICVFIALSYQNTIILCLQKNFSIIEIKKVNFKNH